MSDELPVDAPSYPPDVQPSRANGFGWPALIGSLTALFAVIAIVVIVALTLREQSQSDDIIDQLEARAQAAEAHDDENQAELDCIRLEGGESLLAISAALRADSELVIETAEQVDHLLRGEATTPDALRAQIENVRAAWGVVDRLAAQYVEVLTDCELP